MKIVKKLTNDGKQFMFSVDYQFELLKYLIHSKKSLIYIPRLKSGYFSLIEHAIIAEVLFKVSKKYKKIPGEVILVDELVKLLNTKDYVNIVTKEDIPNLKNVIKKLYSSELQDEDILESSILKFIAYIELTDLTETSDYTDVDGYEAYLNKVSNIVKNIKIQAENTKPLMMISDTPTRQLKRKMDPDVCPTPYKQWNRLTNGGGYPKGSIVVFLDKAKAKKTFNLINVARGYLAMKKVVLYIDTENGKYQIMDRMVQSTLNRTKMELISGDSDKLERRHMRKYKRLKSEFIVQRIIPLHDDANTIEKLIDDIFVEFGLKVNVLVVDYAGKMASISKDKEDFDRISNVYIDLENLAIKKDLDIILSAHHLTREGSKFKETRYEENHIAGSIAIIRNVQVVMGLNSTKDEDDNGIQRWEIVVQRDGVPKGRVVFNVDLPRQRMKELTKEAREHYDDTMGVYLNELINKAYNSFEDDSKKGNKPKQVNPVADPDKYKKKGGDI